MSSIIYNGHEIQDLIINGNQAQLWLNGQKLYPTEEPAPVDTGYYFDFGNTYTLNSGTPGSIDLSNTNLKNATKPYVCIAMDTTITTATGLSNNVISISGFDDSAQVEVYNDISMSTLVSSGALILATNQTTYDIATSSVAPTVLKICFGFYSAGSQRYVNVGYRTSNSTRWSLGNPLYNGNFEPNNFTSISTPGIGGGAIVATKFVGRGFDDWTEARSWFSSLT